MNEGLILRRVYSKLVQLQASPDVDIVINNVVQAACRAPLLQSLLAFGQETQIANDELELRCAGLFLLFAAGNLADDLMDHECDYLSSPLRLGPPIQYLMTSLGWRTLMDCTIERSVLSESMLLLAQGGTAQLPEAVLVGNLSFQQYVAIAEGIAGKQWLAYLRLLADGSTSPQNLVGFAHDLGVASLVASDFESRDHRYKRLDHDVRVEVKRWAEECCARVLQSSSPHAKQMAQLVLNQLRYHTA